MAQPAAGRVSYDVYLATERETGTRHEYLSGLTYAMAGGTPEHDALAANLLWLMRRGLDGKPCAVHGSDLKIRIDSQDVVTYADVAVVCHRRERSDVDRNAVTNPRVIVEVTSPSSEGYDRGEKAGHYRRLLSLDSYVLVAHDREHIEVHERREDGWYLTEAGPGGTITLSSVDVTLSVDDVFRDPLGGSLARPRASGESSSAAD